VDRIAFRRPVDVGDLLRLKSRVVYSSANPHHTLRRSVTTSSNTSAAEKPVLVVEVTCQVVRPET